MPCVLAWRKNQRGALSSSARVSTFLTGLSALSVELKYKLGKAMHTSDFASRHPLPCTSQRCQVCSFVNDWEKIGDNTSEIKAVTVEDIESGVSVMPMTQRKTWLNIQKGDSTHCKLTNLIASQQLPETKKTGGIHTKLKLLHNQYALGKLYIDNDGLVMLKTPNGHFGGSVISVPPPIFPGLVNALHIRLHHPSKNQLINLMARFFYMPGWRTVVDEVSENCHQCATLRKLPKVLIEDTTNMPDSIASQFSADVIERASQRILIVKEKISQFVRGQLIPNQTADTLRNALLSLVLDLIPDTGTEIRVDGATSFQCLEREASTNGSLLNKLKVKVTVGRLLNINKNPTAENAIKEVEKEILRLKPSPGPISETDLQLVLRNVNSRIRIHGLSPKEVLFRRNMLTNSALEVNDDIIVDKLAESRSSSRTHNKKYKMKSHKLSPVQNFEVGDLVYIRNSLDKNNPREVYVVEKINLNNDNIELLIRKFQSTLRPKLYRALPDELIHVPHKNHSNKQDQDINQSEVQLDDTTPGDSGDPLTEALNTRPKRRAALKARTKWKSQINSIRKKRSTVHGWNSDDQMSEDDWIISYNPTPTAREEFEVSSSQNTTSADDSNSSPVHHSFMQEEQVHSDYSLELEGNTSNCDMSWDLSPEQFYLEEQYLEENLHHALQPRELFSSTAVTENLCSVDLPIQETHETLDPPSRHRLMATSEFTVSRSNAFRTRDNLDDALITSPETAASSEANEEVYMEEAINLVSHNLIELIDSPKRSGSNIVPITEAETMAHGIYYPLLPSQVEMNSVNNLHAVLRRPLHTTDQQLSEIHGGEDEDRAGENLRSRRNVRRPRSYKEFHAHGKF